MTEDKNNDRGNKHDDGPQDDNKAKPVTTTKDDKRGNQKK